MRITLIIVLSALFYGCNQNHIITKEEAKRKNDSLVNVLLNLEKEYSDKSMKIGFYHARLDYISDSSIEIMEGLYPLMGKIEIKEFGDLHNDSAFRLKWKPYRAVISESGDLGYTFGNWILYAKNKWGNDTTYYGNYMTIWKKQHDGNWKYEIDGGSNTPKPQE